MEASTSAAESLRLTLEQERAVAAVQQWRTRRDDPLFWLTGYAGTGKSTVAQFAAGDGHVAFLAPTGKAASVLRRKGCVDASTIHKVLYTPKNKSTLELQRLTKALQSATGPERRAELQRLIAAEMDRVNQPHWEYNQETSLASAALVVVDEASMVGEKVLADLLRTVPKVLCLGDPAQLPPVKASSPLLDRRPDFHLETIHRHALDSDVLRAATEVRKTGRLPSWTSPDFQQLNVRETGWDDFRVADQVLVYSNNLRRSVNRRFRARLELPGELAPGDRIVVLRNSYSEGLYNGTTATLTSCEDDIAGVSHSYLVDLESDEGHITGVGVILNEDVGVVDRGSVPVTHGYALTVHKAQGSEWEHVLVWLEGSAERRWLYTALTRASSRLTIVHS